MSAIFDAEEQNELVSSTLQVQQFLDEWHFRALHSNLALTWDRQLTVVRALELFELAGVQFSSEEEKYAFADMPEEDMVACLVERLPPSLTKTIEHFLLQIQLVLSTACRVRSGLEAGSAEEVAEAVAPKDADAEGGGLGSMILKQAIIEASQEVGKLKNVSSAWSSDLAARVGRLSKCAQEAQEATEQLEEAEVRLNGFSAAQNEKAMKVLAKMVGDSNKGLLQTVVFSWRKESESCLEEKRIRKQFEEKLAWMDEQSKAYKASQLKALHGVIQRRTGAHVDALLSEVIASWSKAAADDRAERAERSVLEEKEHKLKAMQAQRKNKAAGALVRICVDSGAELLGFLWQEWVRCTTEAKREAEFSKQVKAQEERMATFLKKQSEEAGKVLQKMIGSTETGLIHSVFKAWAEDALSEKRARSATEREKSVQGVFETLNKRASESAQGSAGKFCTQEDENIKTQIFMNWLTWVQEMHIVRYYGGKMDEKKQQLEAVGAMFKTFASKLEKGIGNSPRSSKPPRQGGGGGGGGGARGSQELVGPS